MSETRIIDLQERVLSGLLRDCEAESWKVMDVLCEDYFTVPEYASVYRAIISHGSSSAEMSSEGVDACFGLLDTFPHLSDTIEILYKMDFSPAYGLVMNNALKLADEYRRSSLIEAHTAAVLELSDRSIPLDEIEAKTALIGNIGKPTFGAGDHALQPLSEIVRMSVDRVKAIYDGKEPLIPIGIPTLDQCFGSLLQTEYVVLAARPSEGKSSIALQSALTNAAAGIRCAYFSLEMSKTDMGNRAVFSNCESANFQQVLSRTFTKQFFGEYMHAVEHISNIGKNLVICSAGAITTGQIDLELRKISRVFKPQIIYIDHFHIMGSDNRTKGASEYQLLTDRSAEIKALTMKYAVPFVVLAQLNRDTAKESRAPMMSDLRGSGSIEQDADRVYLIDKPYGRGSIHQTNIHCAKNRNGQTGAAAGFFHSSRMVFLTEEEAKKYDGEISIRVDDDRATRKTESAKAKFVNMSQEWS